MKYKNYHEKERKALQIFFFFAFEGRTSLPTFRRHSCYAAHPKNKTNKTCKSADPIWLRLRCCEMGLLGQNAELPSFILF